MGNRITKFRSLSPLDRRLLMRAAMALVTARIAVRTMPLRTARKAVLRSQKLRSALLSPPPIERVVWAVETAGRAIPGASNCLVQALAAEAILMRAGYRCDLRIGVAKDGDQGLDAHAWLENGDGEVLIGRYNLSRYRPLAPEAGGMARNR